jgi:hypothetical protein
MTAKTKARDPVATPRSTRRGETSDSTLGYSIAIFEEPPSGRGADPAEISDGVVRGVVALEVQ